MTESVIEALENCAPPLPVAEEGGEQFAQRSENARISESPQRFPGTANRQQATGDAEIPDGVVGDGLPDVPLSDDAHGKTRLVDDAESYDAPVGDGLRTSRDGIMHHGPSGTPAPTEERGKDPSTPLRSAQDDRVGASAQVEGPDPGIMNHLRALHAQAEELKRDFPDFDLDAALHDPAFLRLTAPALGVGVREAFYALNRPRLDELAAARAAEESKALLARAVSGGAQRPREGGGSGAAALLRSDYAALPRERQLALKQRIREAAARGEKMYP